MFGDHDEQQQHEVAHLLERLNLGGLHLFPMSFIFREERRTHVQNASCKLPHQGEWLSLRNDYTAQNY